MGSWKQLTRLACATLLVVVLGLLAGAMGKPSQIATASPQTVFASVDPRMPSASFRKKLRELEGRVTRLSRHVAAGSVRPGTRKLRKRIAGLLILEARAAAALPKLLSTRFTVLHGRLRGIESAVEGASEELLFVPESESVRAALLPARSEARRLKQALRPRGAKAARTVGALMRRLDQAMARLRASRKLPTAIRLDLRSLTALAAGVGGGVPRVHGARFARLHFELGRLEDALVSTLYVRGRGETLAFLADASAAATSVRRAFGLSPSIRSTSRRRGGSETAVRSAAGSLPDRVADLLSQMNAELAGLRDQVESGEVKPGSEVLWNRTFALATLKHRLLGEFPKVFGAEPWRVYAALNLLDIYLEEALRDAADIGAPNRAVRVADMLSEANGARLELSEELRGAPDTVRTKLRELAKRAAGPVMTLARKNAGKELVDAITELLLIKGSVLAELPPIFGAEFGDVYLQLRWLDRALGRAKIGPTASDAIGELRNAIRFKEKLEGMFAATAFSVEVGGTYDHDPPQSDLCVRVATDPPQQGATARISLRGQGPASTASPSEQLVTLDGSGRGQARLLVNAIDTWTAEVEVKTEDGRLAGATASFDNSTPTAEHCG